MDVKQIQELIKLLNKSGVGKMYIKEGDFEIELTTTEFAAAKNTTIATHSVMSPVSITPSPQAIAIPNNVPTTLTTNTAKDKPETINNANVITIKSPMIGTFYRSAGPDKPIYVNVGDEIKVGQVICIIEAMKLFNEIEAEIAGRIVKVLVDDASPIEYDQALFLVEPI